MEYINTLAAWNLSRSVAGAISEECRGIDGEVSVENLSEINQDFGDIVFDSGFPIRLDQEDIIVAVAGIEADLGYQFIDELASWLYSRLDDSDSVELVRPSESSPPPGAEGVSDSTAQRSVSYDESVESDRQEVEDSEGTIYESVEVDSEDVSQDVVDAACGAFSGFYDENAEFSEALDDVQLVEPRIDRAALRMRVVNSNGSPEEQILQVAEWIENYDPNDGKRRTMMN